MKYVKEMPALNERKERLTAAFEESRLAQRVILEKYAPPITPYDTPPDYTRLQRALALGMLIRSIPESDISRFMIGQDTLHHHNPFPAKNVREDGDLYHATFADGSEYTYDVTPKNTHHVTHNDVSVVVPFVVPAELAPINKPFSRDKLLGGTVQLNIPQAYLTSAGNGTPVQKFHNLEEQLQVYVIDGMKETHVCLPRKKVHTFLADFD